MLKIKVYIVSIKLYIYDSARNCGLITIKLGTSRSIVKAFNGIMNIEKNPWSKIPIFTGLPLQLGLLDCLIKKMGDVVASLLRTDLRN